MDSAALDDLFGRAAGVSAMRSLLVAHQGEVVREAYFNGGAPYLLNDVRSVTKSYLSALVGIAIAEGLIRSVHDPISDYLSSVVDLDSHVGAVTLDNLLTMRAGHAWDVYAGEDFRAHMSSPDQLLYALGKPVVEPPGESWVYSDGSAHLVSAVLSEATGKTALSFAEQHLFEPLGVRNRQAWQSDFRGYNHGGVGIGVRTREMCEFGKLYLNGGRRGSLQVIPEDWVEASLRAHVAGVADEMPESSEQPAYPVRFSYGYYWWLGTVGELDFQFAQGYGGQLIVLAPNLELVVVSTTNHQTLDATQNWLNAGRVLRLIIGGAFSAAGADVPAWS